MTVYCCRNSLPAYNGGQCGKVNGYTIAGVLHNRHGAALGDGQGPTNRTERSPLPTAMTFSTLRAKTRINIHRPSVRASVNN